MHGRTERWFPAVESNVVVGRFVDVETVDVKASEEAQKNVYKKVPALQAKVAGSQDVSVQAVKPFNAKELKERFPGAWEHYEEIKAMEPAPVVVEVIAQAPKGTPLHEAPFIPRERLAFLHELGFSTIEQVAEMSDTVVQNLGRGAMTWRKKAQEHLKGK
jgi:hypothetical protein